MEPSALEDAKQALRTFAEQNGLGWLLQEFDEAVAVGFVEVKALRQATRRGLQVYEDVAPAPAAARGRRRAEEFLTRRPMTDQEQVEELIRALRRAIVDPDTVARAAVEQLNDLPIANASGELAAPVGKVSEFDNSLLAGANRIDEIDFRPDEGSSAPTVSTEGIRHSADRRATAGPILDALLAAVRG